MTFDPNIHIKYSCFVTARDSTKIEYIEAYLKANRMYRNYDDPTQDPVYSEVRGSCYGHHNVVLFAYS